MLLTSNVPLCIFCHQVEIFEQGIRLRAEIEVMKRQLDPLTDRRIRTPRNKSTPHRHRSPSRSADDPSPLKSARCFWEATPSHETPKDHRTHLSFNRVTPIELTPTFQPRIGKTMNSTPDSLRMLEKENLPSWSLFTSAEQTESRIWPGICMKAVRPKSHEYFDGLEVSESHTKTPVVLGTESWDTSVWSATSDNREYEQEPVKDETDRGTGGGGGGLDEISCIFGGSFHEHASTSDLNGAFHSTFSYPLHSTLIESSWEALPSPDGHSLSQRRPLLSYDSYTSTNTSTYVKLMKRQVAQTELTSTDELPLSVNNVTSLLYASQDSRLRRNAIRKKLKQFAISMGNSSKRSRNIKTLAHL